jgi:long-chain acyl-CoA synthetase
LYPASRIMRRARDLFSNRVAVIEGDTRLSYAQFADRIDRLASALAGLGLRRGDRVAILDGNSLRYLEAYYACLQAGLAFMPLNSRLAPAEYEYIFNDSEARALLLSAPFLDVWEQLRGKTPSIETVIAMAVENPPAGILDYEDLLTRARPQSDPVVNGPDDIVQIYYTSGTTGDPKGVCLTDANLFHCGVDSALVMDFRADSIWLHSAPMFHLADALAIWTVPLLGGAQVTVPFDPHRVLEAIQTERVTITSLPATLISMIANLPDIGDFDLSSLTQIMYGGSPTPLGVLRKAAETFPENMFMHAYGITETTGLACCLDPHEHTLEVPQGGIHRAASGGHATPLMDARIVDDDGNEVATGEIGEVIFASPKIMKEYWRKPEATAAALKNGWYHSGDMGYFDDTRSVYLVDRKKDMIITGGENVYSVEVENLLSTHPGVLEVAVIGVPDTQWVEAVKAVVVPRDGAGLDEAALIEFCRGRIASYKIPKSVDFADQPLPKTGPGKIAKRRLRDPYWKDQDRNI